jgi:hypothetical protein
MARVTRPAQLGLVARLGVAVAHRRLGPSSSARTSTTDRALPSAPGAVGVGGSHREGRPRPVPGCEVAAASAFCLAMFLVHPEGD